MKSWSSTGPASPVLPAEVGAEATPSKQNSERPKSRLPVVPALLQPGSEVIVKPNNQ
jgi:hypothetical protein